MEDVKCPNCGTLFGKQVGSELTIKHRDLYRTILGRVYGPCRRCGTVITWSSSDNTRPRPTGIEDESDASK